MLSPQGTTGNPKGATLSHYNIVNNSNMIGERLRLHLKVGPGEVEAWRWVVPGWLPSFRLNIMPYVQPPEELRTVMPCPLYHCLGSVGGTMVTLMYGVTLILSSPSFDAKKVLEAISNER